MDSIRKLVDLVLEKQLSDPLHHLKDIDSLAGYERAITQVRAEVQRTAAGAGTITGEREKKQIEILSPIYPVLSGRDALLNETVPWFTELPKNDLAKAYEIVKGWIDERSVLSRIEFALKRDEQKLGITIQTVESLLADLVGQLSRK